MSRREPDPVLSFVAGPVCPAPPVSPRAAPRLPLCAIPLADTGLLRGRVAAPTPQGSGATPASRFQKIPSAAPGARSTRGWSRPPASPQPLPRRPLPLRGLLILNVGR
jgi:hypothetical protein